MRKIKPKRIAVLIPCYNEANTIGKVINDYKRYLPEADIYVYDNNSIDETDKIAREAGAIVRYEPRQGKGNAIRTMFREIEADCYIMVDGDDTYPAKDAPEMARLVLEQKVDMVIGDRLSSTYFTENKRRFHNLGNILMRFLVNSFFKSDIKDIMTGYRAFSRSFIKSFPVISKGFEIETEMTVHALDKNFMVTSIPVQYQDRPVGSVSKLKTISDGSKVLKTVFRLYRDYRPLPFFGACALILLVVSLILFIPVLVTYLQTGLVPRLPTLVTSGILFVLSMLSFTCGVILDTIAQKYRQSFEIQRTLLDLLLKRNDFDA